MNLGLDRISRNCTNATTAPHEEFLRRTSKGNSLQNIIDPLKSRSTAAAESSSQCDLRRLRGIGGGSQGWKGGRVGTSPCGTKITSFAQSVLALHRLQDSRGIHLNASKRNTTNYLGSGGSCGLARVRYLPNTTILFTECWFNGYKY